MEQDVTTVAGAGDGQGTLDDAVSEDGIVLDASGDVARPDGGAVSYAPGAQVRIRDEQWLVRKVAPTARDGWMVEVTGVTCLGRHAIGARTLPGPGPRASLSDTRHLAVAIRELGRPPRRPSPRVPNHGSGPCSRGEAVRQPPATAAAASADPAGGPGAGSPGGLDPIQGPPGSIRSGTPRPPPPQSLIP